MTDSLCAEEGSAERGKQTRGWQTSKGLRWHNVLSNRGHFCLHKGTGSLGIFANSLRSEVKELSELSNGKDCRKLPFCLSNVFIPKIFSKFYYV